jgi:Fe-S-cluster containining protein
VIDIFALGPHAAWRCRHSGACCTSNWPIDIDAPRRDRLAAAVRDGAIALPPGAAPFETHDEETDAASVVPSNASARQPRIDGATEGGGAGSGAHPIILGRTPHGACVFHDGEARRCRVHGALGHAALPLACRQFPRVCLTDPRGVRVSLSHYCPSAAARLFDEALPLTIVRAPDAFPAGGEYDGLDARDAFPPLLRPGVLMDWETVDALEQLGVALFAAETASPRAALDRFAAICEALRGWRAADGPMAGRLRAIAADTAGAAGAAEPADAAGAAGSPASGGVMSASYEEQAALLDWPEILKRDAEVRASDPAPHDDTFGPAAASEEMRIRSAYLSRVAPVWGTFTRPVCRYLAARLFGGWCWYQGQGLRSLVRSLDAALSVLQIEAARQMGDDGSMLDREQLREAIRQTDLRLLHLASPDALAARWSDAEQDSISIRSK